MTVPTETLSGWNLLEIITQAKSELGDTGENFFKRDEMVRWTNFGQMDFCRRSRILTTESTATGVTGQANYSLPPDFMVMQKVFYADREIYYVNKHELLLITQQSRLTDQGTPSHWYVRGTQQKNLCFYLYKVPGTTGETITLWYVQKPNTLTDDTDIPILDGMWHNALVLYLIWRGRRKRRETNLALDARAEYEQMVMDAKEWSERPTESRPRTIQDWRTWSNSQYAGREGEILDS